MFRDTKAFSGFSVGDLQQARQFYADTLGLAVTENKEMPVLELHIAGGIPILVYEKQDHVPATFTILNFPVKDIVASVAALKAKGVSFLSYDTEAIRTDEDHIFRGGGPLIAWFRDPAGNILSVLETER